VVRVGRKNDAGDACEPPRGKSDHWGQGSNGTRESAAQSGDTVEDLHEKLDSGRDVRQLAPSASTRPHR
jgi:hypothetical protein